MKLSDIDKVNHLISELGEVDSLLRTAEQAEPEVYQLFVEAPGDASLKLSAEGESTIHSRGIAVSAAFLAGLKASALAELRARRGVVLAALTALGVDTAAG